MWRVRCEMHRILVCLLLLLLPMAGCKQVILHNLNEREANQFLTKLSENGVKSSKSIQPDGKWSLLVERSLEVPALRILEGARLLNQRESAAQSKSNIVASREEQRFQYERSLSREIETTISHLSGVYEARVHLNLAPTDPLFGRQTSNNFIQTASVLVVHEKEVALAAPQVAELVSGASGIPLDKVSVVLMASESSAVQSTPLSLGTTQQNFEWMQTLAYLLLGCGLLLFVILLIRRQVTVRSVEHESA